MSRLQLRSALYALTALTTVACTALLGDFEVGSSSSTSSSGNNGDGGGGEGGTNAVNITPTEAKLGILRAKSFTADGDVTWSVQEGDAGGSVDATGKYISPDKPGVYHVIATSKSDPTKTSTATVTVVPLGVVLLAGKPGGPGNIDGAPLVARFRQPGGYNEVQLAGQNVALIGDTGNHTIRKFQAGKVTTLAGKSGEAGNTGGIGDMARLNRPTKIATDDNGSKAWFLDAGNFCIRQLDVTTGSVATFAGTCGTSGSTDGVRGTGTLGDVNDLVLGPKKTALFVCDRDPNGGSGTIRRIDVSTGAITTVVNLLTGVPFTQCRIAPWQYPSQQLYISAYVNGDNTGDEVFVANDTGSGLGTPTKEPYQSPEVYTKGIAPYRGFGGDNDVYILPQSDAFIYRFDYDTPANGVKLFTGVAGNTDAKYIDGPFADARFIRPEAIVSNYDRQTLNVVDSGGHTIRRIDTGSQQISTVLGAPPNVERIDGPRATARITAPFGVTTDDAGNVFISDAAFERPPNNTIRKYDVASATISTVSGVPFRYKPPTDVAADGPKDAAKFAIPMDLVRVGGDLFVVDVLGQAIRKVNIATGEAKTFAGELNVPGTSDGVGAAAHFKFFASGNDDSGFGIGIATDGTNLYVSDGQNFAIRKVVIATGEVTTIAGGSEGTVNGNGKAAQFKVPAGLAIADGFLYIADAGDNTIRKMDLKTNEVTSFMGLSGVLGGKNGDATEATFARPTRLAADGIGNLYVTEAPGLFGGIPTIRRIDIKARKSFPFAGQPFQSGFATGPLPSTLNCPSAIHVDAKGDLVFSDFCDGVIGVIQAL